MGSMKREVAFLIKTQNGFPALLGRTRSRKFEERNGVCEEWKGKKRFKGSKGNQKVLMEENVENDLTESESKGNQERNFEKFGAPNESLRLSGKEGDKGESLKLSNGSLGKIVMGSEEMNNLDEPISMQSPNPERNEVLKLINDSIDKTTVGGEERSNLDEPMNKGGHRRGFTDSALKSMAVVVPCYSNSHRVEGGGVESTIVIDAAIGVEDTSTRKPARRFTRAALKSMGDGKAKEGSQVQNNSETSLGQSVHSNSALTRELRENNEGKSTKKEEASLGVTNLSKDDNEEVKNASVEKPEMRASSTLKIGVVAFVHEEVGNASKSKSNVEYIENDAYKKVQNGLSEKTPRGKTKDQVMDGNVRHAPQEKSLRRCTRSSLKTNVEPLLAPLADSLSGSSTSIVSEDACENGEIMSSQIRRHSKKKLEMKMSKKITLTNVSGIRKLLGTGLLEGLPVKYMFVGGQKDEGLRGTIKDCGILCSCILCKGCKVVTPIQFEKHAGSTNRNPAYYIYLDNGRSLRDVMNTCKDAPLGMLEAVIQSAVSSSPVDNVDCQMCKRPLPVSRTRRKISLCNLCLKLEKVQATPACSASIASRSSQPAVTPKSSGSLLKSIPKGKSSQRKLRFSKSLTPKSSDSMFKSVSLQRKPQGKLTRKDLGMHKLVFETGILPDGAELRYIAQGKIFLKGYKNGFGIFCTCCKTKLSASQFEAHAGHAPRRKPYLHIYTSNGVSLHELSVSLLKERKLSVNDNDDRCSKCLKYGDLLLCDGCPRAFHRVCANELVIPRGDWYCRFCRDNFENMACAHNANAKAAGRVSGVDPIEQITKRCIRIVQTPELEVGGCSLCRCPGFSESGFGPQTIIICDQCEREFHVGCLKERDMCDLKELPEGNWFCSVDCRKIHSALLKLINRGSEKLTGTVLEMITKKNEENCSNSDLDISWSFLSGKIASPESQSLLSKAVDIFHDCFDPIVDSVTGCDLIPKMVYGKNIREQDFGGMFCAVLTVNSHVASAGILRILGHEFAELPLVATSNGCQGKGYFQSLFACIERLLAFLKVKDILLPAASGAEAIWTEKFGFQKMSDEEARKYQRDYQLTVFQGVSMLRKPVPECRTIKSASKAQTVVRPMGPK